MVQIQSKENAEQIAKYPDVVAEWSKILVPIQVAISPLQTQVQIPLGTI